MIHAWTQARSLSYADLHDFLTWAFGEYKGKELRDTLASWNRKHGDLKMFPSSTSVKDTLDEMLVFWDAYREAEAKKEANS